MINTATSKVRLFDHITFCGDSYGHRAGMRRRIADFYDVPLRNVHFEQMDDYLAGTAITLHTGGRRSKAIGPYTYREIFHASEY